MFLLFSLAKCWSEEALLIQTEAMFRVLGDTGPQMVQQVLDIADEVVDRPSLAAAFLSYVERPPYNTECFNHWRFTKKPYNPEGLEIVEHSNSDDLESTVNSLLKSVESGSLNGAWPYNFGFKTFLTLYLESFDPLHNVEYFSSNFPTGDDSGKKFVIYDNKKATTLYDFWTSGCGRFNRTSPHSQAVWKDIDNEVTELIKNYPLSYIESVYDKKVFKSDIWGRETSYNISVSDVYTGISPNQEISSSYRSKCIEITDIRMAQAAYALANELKYEVKIPDIKKNPATFPIKTSEAIGWSITCMLAPLTIYLILHYFHMKSKSD